jgi:ribonuclease-3
VTRAVKQHDAPALLSDAARFAIVQRATGHTFANQELVRRAVTHPSAVEDRDPDAYYERLEFLGDSVLGLIVAEEIYRRFPAMPEGGMTRIKVSVVSGTALAKVSADLGLGEAIIFGDSERGTGGRGMSSALENVFEALIAALYLDGGIDLARRWVLDTLGPLLLEEAAESPENPKSALQELTQAHGEAPSYRVVSQDGPPHDRIFTAAVEVGGKVLGEGSGHSKKEAEAVAAQVALESLTRRRKRARS